MQRDDDKKVSHRTADNRTRRTPAARHHTTREEGCVVRLSDVRSTSARGFPPSLTFERSPSMLGESAGDDFDRLGKSAEDDRDMAGESAANDVDMAGEAVAKAPESAAPGFLTPYQFDLTALSRWRDG